MRIRPYVYVSLALVAALPSAALAGATVQVTISPTAAVAVGSTVAVTCRGEGSPPSGMGGSTVLKQIAVTVDGGSVTPSTLTNAVSAPCTSNAALSCSVIDGTVQWVTPPAAATYQATCTVTYQGTFGGAQTTSATALLTTVAAAYMPPVVGAVTGPDELLVGKGDAFSVTAADPNDPKLPLTVTWSATGGTIVQEPANPAAATWTAPAVAGAYEIVAAVSNGAATVESRKAVSVVLASYESALPVALAAPTRLAVDGDGNLYAVDGQQGERGQVVLITRRGEARGFSSLPEQALAVAAGGGYVWVTTVGGSLYKIDPRNGKVLGAVALDAGPLQRPLGIAFDPVNLQLWIAELDADRVRVVRPDGTTAAMVRDLGGAPLRAPIDVAIDGRASGAKAWVVVQTAKLDSGLAAGEPVSAARFLHAFDLSGTYLASYAAHGGAAGQISRGGGVAVGPDGRVHVADAFQGIVQVFEPTGAAVGVVGTYGDATGQLLNPMGVVVLASGDLAVANSSAGRVDRFGSGTSLPGACAGDRDCDGLSDQWELDHGLNPDWAGDALLDLDGDGLVNVDEYRAGTDPRLADSDGDGYSDGAEVAAGYDPTNPNDRRPVVAVSGPTDPGPGLVRLSAVAYGAGTCSFAWAQASGAAVNLKDAATAQPSFVVQAPGAYAFQAVATCGGVASLPGAVTVNVKNVPPLADAGRVTVVPPGGSIRLDAFGSGDANGDALTFSWDQLLGAPVTGTAPGQTLAVRPRGAGLYDFQVTVTDAAGATATAEVPVVVAAGPVPTAIAAALPSEGQVGTTVVLDASASVGPGGAAFVWTQVGGPTAQLQGRYQDVAWFVPAEPGRYAFEVSVDTGVQRSPPARVEVFVAPMGGTLPTVVASAPSIVAVGSPVALEASVAGGAVDYAWKQVSGPAAGIGDTDRATATAVPFAPGFYVFEVTVREGAVEGRPFRVAFEARASGRAIPVARIAPVDTAWVGQFVFLDGAQSAGATRYRWTQVEGPWVPVGAQTARTSFRPLVAGTYVFELEVDDGRVRSAPARVEINVVPAEVK